MKGQLEKTSEGARWALGAAKGWAPLAAPLMAPSLFLCEYNSRKFSADSEKLPRTTFLKQKTTEKGSGTGHLVNRLVP